MMSVKLFRLSAFITRLNLVVETKLSNSLTKQSKLFAFHRTSSYPVSYKAVNLVVRAMYATFELCFVSRIFFWVISVQKRNSGKCQKYPSLSETSSSLSTQTELLSAGRLLKKSLQRFSTSFNLSIKLGRFYGKKFCRKTRRMWFSLSFGL